MTHDTPSGPSYEAELLRPPAKLDLAESFDGTVRFVQELRKRRESGADACASFVGCEQVSLSGALMLAAETRRWRDSKDGGRLQLVGLDSLPAEDGRLLAELGALDGFADAAHDDDRSDFGRRYTRMRIGSLNGDTMGEEAHSLISMDLQGLRVPDKGRLYAAITEALVNIMHHAYAQEGDAPDVGKWWMATARHSELGFATVALYDEGATIPGTLMLTRLEQSARRCIPDFLWPHDAHIIKAAHQMGRCRTGEAHRGKGLPTDIRAYIMGRRHGAYHVFSGRGEYAVHDGHNEVVRGHDRRLQGTLITWCFPCPPVKT